MASAQPPSLEGLANAEDSVLRSRYQCAPEASNACKALGSAGETNESAFVKNSLSGWPTLKSKLSLDNGPDNSGIVGESIHS